MPRSRSPSPSASPQLGALGLGETSPRPARKPGAPGRVRAPGLGAHQVLRRPPAWGHAGRCRRPRQGPSEDGLSAGAASPPSGPQRSASGHLLGPCRKAGSRGPAGTEQSCPSAWRVTGVSGARSILPGCDPGGGPGLSSLQAPRVPHVAAAPRLRCRVLLASPTCPTSSVT